MMKYNVLLISLLAIFLFIIGNIVYNTTLSIILKVAISELSFILLYTIIDKFNIKYGLKFTLLSLLVLVIFYLPYFEFLFYSKNVQYFSISISLATNILNALMVKNLINNGIKNLMSSRISTITASLIEVSLFVYLLEIGINGLFFTTMFRLLYIYIVPKILFYKGV
jgi:hypothetical protein